MTRDEDGTDEGVESGREPEPEPDREPVSVGAALDAGRMLLTQGHLRAARESFERAWRPLPTGSDDERLLRGLIGLLDAVRGARRGDSDGVRAAAATARESLASVPAGHRGIAVGDLGEHLATLSATAADPTVSEREPLPDLAPDAPDPLTEPDLDAVLLAVELLADAVDGVDPAVVADAARYAREERGTGRTRYAELLTAFLSDPDQRAPVYARLRDRVERERAKEDDVAGLF
ncbi:hypothetical protein [Haloparvum sedimenti]|uniref:hypothetical protein n=1 Tax=Haloparvum sedimenti TaxID=1678448 RepID=UPI00071E95AA|nr:hypothetical protein [Haloparvum sedimenti]